MLGFNDGCKDGIANGANEGTEYRSVLGNALGSVDVQSPNCSVQYSDPESKTGLSFGTEIPVRRNTKATHIRCYLLLIKEIIFNIKQMQM